MVSMQRKAKIAFFGLWAAPRATAYAATSSASDLRAWEEEDPDTLDAGLRCTQPPAPCWAKAARILVGESVRVQANTKHSQYARSASSFESSRIVNLDNARHRLSLV